MFSNLDPRWKTLLISLLLGAGGFFLNGLNIELFFGVNIIFGGILSMVVVLAYGPAYGVLATLVSSSYTYILWGHPYAVIIFTAQALAVGIMTRKSKKWTMAAAVAFWLVAGMPMVYLFYYYVLHLPITPTILIALKQSTNGIFNWSVAAVVLLLPPVRRMLLGGGEHRISLPNVLTATLSFLTGMILFVVTGYQGNRFYAELNQQIRRELVEITTTVERNFEDFLNFNEPIVRSIGKAALGIEPLNNRARNSGNTLRSHMDEMLEQSPYLNRVIVADNSGMVVATIPPPVRDAETTAPPGETNFQSFIRSRVVGNRGAIRKFHSEGTGGGPLLTVTEALSDESGQPIGIVRSVVKLNGFGRHLENAGRLAEDAGISVMMIDASQRIVFSIRDSEQAGKVYDRTALVDQGDQIFLRFPKQDLPAMVRWGKSSMVHIAPIPRLGVSIVTGLPLLRHLVGMQTKYIELLLMLFILMVSIVLLTTVMSTAINWQIRKVIAYAARIGGNIENRRLETSRLDSNIAEIDLLYTNFSQLESELRESFWKLKKRSLDLEQAILDSVADGMIIIDEKGTIETYNPAAERIFGYEAKEVIGGNVKVLMPSPDREMHDDYLARYLRTGETKAIGISRELVGMRKDESTFPMDLSISEMFLDERRLFIGVVRDLTDRMKTEDALRESEGALVQLKQAQMFAELQASQDARIDAYRDFIHTIGNLITPVRAAVSLRLRNDRPASFLDQLLQRLRMYQEKQEGGELAHHLDSEGKEDISRFMAGLNYLKEHQENLTVDLKTIDTAFDKIIESTYAQSRLQKELSIAEELDLVAVVHAVLSLMEDTWRSKGITWQITAGDNDSNPETIPLKVEKVRLFNMIQNVLKNAGEAFTDPDQPEKEIAIQLRATEEEAVLEVFDNGRGITLEELEQVGHIGFTTKSRTEFGEGGSGLGVHNCQIFMGRIGGRFQLTSAGQGEGARATMVFPKEVLA